MSYEVVKTIHGRDYRYMVESHRDPQTGKVRNKWQYLGKAEGGAAPKRRRRAEETRASLVTALEAILERIPWQDVTVRAIAQEAGLAEATFYRYFRSRNDLLLASVRRLLEEGDARLAALVDVAGTIADERRRLREWVSETLSSPHGSAVLFALWTSGPSAELRQQRFERRRDVFREYLQRLEQREFIVLDASAVESLATALALLVQSFSYRTVIERRTFSGDESVALASMMERIVFG